MVLSGSLPNYFAFPIVAIGDRLAMTVISGTTRLLQLTRSIHRDTWKMPWNGQTSVHQTLIVMVGSLLNSVWFIWTLLDHTYASGMGGRAHRDDDKCQLGSSYGGWIDLQPSPTTCSQVYPTTFPLSRTLEFIATSIPRSQSRPKSSLNLGWIM
jgi:hypothetical protein